MDVHHNLPPSTHRLGVYAGLEELALASMPVASVRRASSGGPDKRRIRVQGGGRKKLTAKHTTLLRDLDALVEPTARGAPQSALRWTCQRGPRPGMPPRGEPEEVRV